MFDIERGSYDAGRELLCHELRPFFFNSRRLRPADGQPDEDQLGGTMDASTEALGSMSGMFGARFRRLTARELRLLVLVIDDRLRLGEISETLRQRRQCARRHPSQLAVPSHDDLRQFVLSLPELATLVREVDSSDLAAATIERRERHVLRTTITEIEAVARRVRRRAEALGMAAGSDAREELGAEVRTVLSIAELIDQLLDQAVSLARQRPERTAAM